MPDRWVSDESAFDDCIDPRAAPDYNADIVYYEASGDSSDDQDDANLENVGELDRVPAFPHETELSASSGSLDRTGELDSTPILSHERQYAGGRVALHLVFFIFG